MIDPAPAATPSPSESSNGKKGPTCKVFRSGNAAISQESFGEISEILTQPDVLVWFDLVDPDANDLQVLKSEFDLHPLAIEDAVMAHERPKIEQYGDYWFLVLRPATQQENGNAVFHEMAVFAGEKFLITVRHQPEYPLKELEERWNAHPKQLRQGGGFLLYTILDTVVDGYFPVVSDLEDQIEQLEEELFQRESYSTAVLRTIFAFKRQGQRLRHAIMPMRDILNPIIRGDITLFPEDLLAYYRDVYDHSVRAIDQLDTMRDLLATALDIHLSVVANRQNEVMKQLAVIATIFLPLSFIVGFFGQNFSFLVSHITGTGTFWLLGIGSEIVFVVAMLAIFKVRGWF